MAIIHYQPADEHDEQSRPTDTHKRTPTLIFTHAEVEARSGSGDCLDAITIDVVQPDGSKARFFLSVDLNNQNRARLHVATNKGTCGRIPNSTRKSVTGDWR
jgi:hypothetical protein